MYSPGSVASMRQGKVSRAQAVKCPENTQGISKGVTTFHPYKTCDFPFSMSLDETYKKKKNITLRVWLFSIFIPLYRFSYIAFLLSRNTKKYLENSIPLNTVIHFQERKSFRKKKDKEIEFLSQFDFSREENFFANALSRVFYFYFHAMPDLFHCIFSTQTRSNLKFV